MTSLFSRLTRPFSSGGALRFGAEGTAANQPEGSKEAIFAAGCFWGVEHMYRKAFGKDGLIDARVGYIGGAKENPSYRAVCSGTTGHAEALQVIYDPDKLTYRQLVEFFYKMHDPTTANRQGPDTGTQYRSGIYYRDEQDGQIAREITEKVQQEWWKNGKISTEIAPAGKWWDAETYHQLYLDKNPHGYECPSHFLRKFPPLSS